MENQRSHPLISLFQKVFLNPHDFGGHLEQRLVPLLQTLDKPSGFLHLLFEVRLVWARIIPLDQRRVLGVDPNLGVDAWIDFNDPA